MRFGTKVGIAMLAVSLLPLSALAYTLRVRLGDLLVAEHQQRVDDAAAAVDRTLEAWQSQLGEQLVMIRHAAVEDNALRAAIASGQGGDRQYLLGYAERVMALAGMSVLQLHDERGRILSSGQFRQDYDRLESGVLDALLRSRERPVLARMRAPDGAMVALVRLDSLRIGGRTTYLVGGVRLDDATLQAMAPGSGIAVELAATDTTVAAASGSGSLRLVRQLKLDYVTDRGVEEAELRIMSSDDGGAALRETLDRTTLIVAVSGALVALLLAAWLAARVSHPVAQLAERAGTLDLDQLTVDFRSDRDDEIGDLSRTLGAMTARLRASVRRLRDAERRATQGEMARQVNHDIKNGLVPIRNVLRHLAQVSRQQPEELPRVFVERERTLASSVEYLEQLARTYARLSPRQEVAQEATPLPVVAGEVLTAAAASAPHAELRLELAEDTPPPRGDAMAIRRILENLVGNAVDSLEGKSGRITLSGERARSSGVDIVRLTVADNGRGMSEAELSRAFEDFHTTKEGGTGLGLTVVRRLVADLEGSLRVETRPGEGTRVIVELPGSGGERERGYAAPNSRQTEGSRL
jgi:signal transduction histidine kinase